MMRSTRRSYFNSRPRMRANKSEGVQALGEGIFQLPPSHEGEHRRYTMDNSTLTFQLPPSHEGEPWPRPRSRPRGAFQLPPSHEGERIQAAVLRNGGNFNSRPRMRANTGHML